MSTTALDKGQGAISILEPLHRPAPAAFFFLFVGGHGRSRFPPTLVESSIIEFLLMIIPFSGYILV
jgi:hypothetical protein